MTRGERITKQYVESVPHMQSITGMELRIGGVFVCWGTGEEAAKLAADAERIRAWMAKQIDEAYADGLRAGKRNPPPGSGTGGN
jgi:hypothetical protein